MSQKTLPTDVPVEEYLAGLDARRASEGEQLVALFRDVTGTEPVMWGPSMIGFGEYEYTYASGHSGTWPKAAFSPRKAELSFYGLQAAPEAAELLERLGPHRRGVDCVYVRRLEAVDLDVLRALVAASWTYYSTH